MTYYPYAAGTNQSDTKLSTYAYSSTHYEATWYASWQTSTKSTATSASNFSSYAFQIFAQASSKTLTLYVTPRLSGAEITSNTTLYLPYYVLDSLYTTNDRDYWPSPTSLTGDYDGWIQLDQEYYDSGTFRRFTTVLDCSDTYNSVGASIYILIDGAGIDAGFTYTGEDVASITVITDLDNCTIDGVDTDTTYTTADTLDITITANEGYTFATTPYLTIGASATHILFAQQDSGIYALTADLSTYDIDSDVTIYIYASAVDSTERTRFGLVEIYQPTQTQLNDLALQRFYTVSSELTTYEPIDIGQYITTLYMCYGAQSYTGSYSLILGTTDTGIAMHKLGYTSITHSFGSAELPDFDDATNTDIQIYIPFEGFQSLDTAAVSGKTLALAITTSLYTGDATVAISIDDTPIATYDTHNGYTVPYRSSEISISDYDINPEALNGVIPYILAYTPQQFETGVAGKYTDTIIEDIPATKSELDELQALLAEGIQYNDD